MEDSNHLCDDHTLCYFFSFASVVYVHFAADNRWFSEAKVDGMDDKCRCI